MTSVSSTAPSRWTRLAGNSFATSPSDLAGEPRYKVTIRLEGMDLPYVAAVTYRLHRSFKERTHRVDRTILNPDCALTIWTWGLFVVHVTIHLKSGHQIPVDHELHYDEAIRAAAPDQLQWSAIR